MTNSSKQTPDPTAIEQLLSSLAGIISARAIIGAGGRLEEIHILATAELHPKQIVRNVESALGAGLGLEINRRIVSVAQLREGVHEGVAESTPKVPHPQKAAPISARAETRTESAPRRPGAGPAARAGDQRLIFMGHEVSIDTSRNVTCRVVLRAGEAELTGTGEGFDSPQGRAEAAARAAMAALESHRATDQVGLEGVAIVEAAGGEYVLISARPIRGRQRKPLTGAAPLRDSPEEAAILAVLQATNHWRSSN